MAGVPSNIIVPFVGVEFDNSRAGSASALNFQTLIFGQKTTAGTGTARTIVKVSSADEVRLLGGPGSQLHQMAKAYFANNQAQDTYIYLLEDASGGSAAAYTLTITAADVLAGELDLYIDGYRIAVAVTAGMTPTTLGDAIVAAITAELDNLPITAPVNTTGVLTFSAKNDGTVGNGLDFRVNYYDGEVYPSGVSVVFAVATPGAVDVTLTNMITDLGEEWYQVWIGPYTDATNIAAIEDELSSRFGVIRQNDGVYITAKKDTNANLITYSTTSGRNSPHVCTVGCYKYPSSVYAVAGAYGGVVMASVADDSGKPLHRNQLVGILPPRKEERDTIINRNSIALKGIATLDPTNGVATEACVTMYLTNSAGAADTSYQQLNSMFILMVLRYRFRNLILTRYPQARLADSAIRVKSGMQIITPEIGKAEAIAWFLAAEEDGLVENLTQFKDQVVCQRSVSNRNRLEWLLPPDLINQFIVGSAILQFRN